MSDIQHQNATPGSIAFLGFGEAARAFCGSLQQAEPEIGFLAYDIKLRGAEREEMLGAMAALNVTACESADGLAGADWIFSAVTADQSRAAVQPLLPALRPGNTVFDINSVAPERKRETAAMVRKRGAAYVDMAVMTPVHPRGHRSPVLLGGPTPDILAGLDSLGFSFDVAGPNAGDATAIKMVRSLFVKGLEAITVETLLAAERSGCRDAILASLSKSYPGLGWPEIATYHFDRTLTHGTRRAAEMMESGATLDQLGLNGGLAREIAAVQAAMGRAGTGALHAGDLQRTISEALGNRLDATVSDTSKTIRERT